jgi:FkbM family methyltransferase
MNKLDDNYSQATEIELVKRLAKLLSSYNFLDIGAEKGMFSSAMLELGMSGVMFEPMPRHLPELHQIIKKFQNVSLQTCAITNIDIKENFNIATDENGRELDYFHSLQKAAAVDIFRHSQSFEVECRSIESLVKEGVISPEVGILKIDTEGNDLNVLRGLGSLRPEVIICEYFTQGLYEGWVEGAPEKAIEHMRELGYKMFIAIKRMGDLEVVGLCTSLFEEKQWGNLFFFRDDFYARGINVIAECILMSEGELLGRLKKLSFELGEKEKVIHILDAEVKRLLLLRKENQFFKELKSKVMSWVQ